MNPYTETNDAEITLKSLIEQAGTNQRQLSKESGVSEGTINSWVAGKYTPTLDNAAQVAKTLGISLKCLAKSIGIDTKGVPDDLNLTELKIIANQLDIEKVEDLPENYQTLKQMQKHQN